MNDDQGMIGRLISWREPNKEHLTIGICCGVDCKPSLKHRRGRYLLVKHDGKMRYLDLDDTDVRVLC